MTADAMLRAALAYAERLAWAVFPLAGKVPAGGSGYLDATTDAATVASFWSRYPGANIGVSCIASGFVTIDVDPRNGGDVTLAEIEAKLGQLPHTVRQITGGGGQHILFRAPPELQPRGSIGAGNDVKFRGYIVGAPSVHPGTGRQYAWAPGHHPLQTPIAELTPWLAELLTHRADSSPVAQARPPIEEVAGWGPKPRYSRAALERACAAIERAPAGQQDQTLNAEAYSIGRLIGAGLMPRQLAIDCLTYAGSAMGNEPGRVPWHARKIQQKVVRAVSEGERSPRAVAA